jgi:hypothetical protein
VEIITSSSGEEYKGKSFERSRPVRATAGQCSDPRLLALLLSLADAIDREEPGLRAFLVRKLNEFWFVITRQGNKVLYGEEYEMGRLHCLRYKAAFCEAFANWTIDPCWIDPRSTGKPVQKPIKLVDLWLKSPARRGYPELVFDPSMRPQLQGDQKYNVFKGLAIDAQTAAAAASTASSAPSVQPVLDHIRDIWCRGDDTAYDYVLNWMALLVQKPWEIPGTCIFLFGEQGAGKGAIMKLLGKIIGDKHYLPTTDSEDVVGKFTGQLQSCLLLFADEGTAAGNNKKKTAGRLKALITEEKQRIQEKFKDVCYMPNYTHVIFASNEKDSLPIEPRDRRTFVLRTDDKYSGVQTPESKQYFDRLRSVPAEVFADFLYRRDISTFNSRMLPMTAARREVLEDAASSPEKFWLRCLQSGCLDPDDATEGVWPTSSVPKDKVYTLYKAACVRDLVKAKGAKDFWIAMYKMIGPKDGIHLPRQSKDKHGKQPYMIQLPSLADCRAKWRQFRNDPAFPFDPEGEPLRSVTVELV